MPSREALVSLVWVANQSELDTANAVRAAVRVSYDPKTRQIPDSPGATAHLGLTYLRRDSLDVGFVYQLSKGVYEDADCASRTTYRRSTSGAVVLCGGASVA